MEKIDLVNVESTVTAGTGTKSSKEIRLARTLANRTKIGGLFPWQIAREAIASAVNPDWVAIIQGLKKFYNERDLSREVGKSENYISRFINGSKKLDLEYSVGVKLIALYQRLHIGDDYPVRGA